MDSLAAVIATQIPRRVPGLSIAVVDKSGLRWAKGFGRAVIDPARPHDPDSGQAASADTGYLWFSMTKIVSATAVMLLAESGRLGLDQPAADWLPEFAIVLSPKGRGRVTLRHLLSHSAGLANPLPVAWVRPAGMPAPDSRAFCASLLRRYPRLLFEPGSQAAYSNLGYLVLGEIISIAAGQPYVDFVREHILTPLGMHGTDFEYQPAMLPMAAAGYQPRYSPLNPLFRMMLPRGIWGRPAGRFVSFNRFLVNGPAYGGLVGPASDAARFLAMHLPGSKVSGPRLFSEESLLEMQQLRAKGKVRDIGLGWFRGSQDRSIEPLFVEHLGAGGGFFNGLRVYPSLGLGIVMLGNATAYGYRELMQAVLAEELN